MRLLSGVAMVRETPNTRRRAAVVVLVLSLAACSQQSIDPTFGSSTTPVVTQEGDGGTADPNSTATTPASATSAPSTTGGASTTVPASVTTVPASSTTTASTGDAGDTIGAVGCSMTSDAVVGYFAVGGTRFWNIRGDYGGGAVGMWARGVGGVWSSFDENLAANPGTDFLWWQLCTLNGSQRDGVDAAVLVLEGLRARMPGVTIYVSPQPDYVPAGICDISGTTGPAFMAEVAANLVSQEGLLEGPVTGPLTEADTIGGCHASESGQVLMGQQLLAAFG